MKPTWSMQHVLDIIERNAEWARTAPIWITQKQVDYLVKIGAITEDEAQSIERIKIKDNK